MPYPDDPSVVASLSPQQWELLLAAIFACPPSGRRKLIMVQGTSSHDRRKLVNELLAYGMSKGNIARKLGVSAGLISKIIKGER